MANRRSVVLAIMALVLATGCQTGRSSPAPPAATHAQLATPAVPSPTPVTSQPAESPLPFNRWEPTTLPDAAPEEYGGGLPNDVITFGSTYVAVGGVNGGCCTGAFSEATRGLVWTSTDGIAWQLAPDQPSLALGRLAQVATDGARLVAVGTMSTPSTRYPGSAQPVPAAWTSIDGITWELLDGAPPLTSIAASEAGWVGAVNATDELGIPLLEVGSAIWTSADGLAWNVLAGPDVLGAGEIRSVALDASGRIAAAGGDVDRHGTLWTGSLATGMDGRATVSDLSTLTRIAWTDGQIVAAGLNSRGAGALLLPSGEATWTAVDLPGAGANVRDLLDGASGLLATGSVLERGRSVGAAWWMPTGGIGSLASDGLSDASEQVVAAIISEERVIAVGSGWDPASGHAVPIAWLSTR